MAFKINLDKPQPSAKAFYMTMEAGEAGNAQVVQHIYLPVNSATIRTSMKKVEDLTVGVAHWADTRTLESGNTIHLSQNGALIVSFNVLDVVGYGTTYGSLQSVLNALHAKLFE